MWKTETETERGTEGQKKRRQEKEAAWEPSFIDV